MPKIDNRSKAGHAMASQMQEDEVMAEREERRARAKQATDELKPAMKGQGHLDRAAEKRRSDERALQEQKLIDELRAAKTAEERARWQADLDAFRRTRP